MKRYDLYSALSTTTQRTQPSVVVRAGYGVPSKRKGSQLVPVDSSLSDWIIGKISGSRSYNSGRIPVIHITLVKLFSILFEYVVT